MYIVPLIDESRKSIEKTEEGVIKNQRGRMVSREQKRGSLKEKFQLLRSITNSHAVTIASPSLNFFFYCVRWR